ncbi:MAG: hypothetical protein Q8878_03220, partial [Bacillota bacterium]|nr:hypothetical protein [Bacillota bacterium]
EVKTSASLQLIPGGVYTENGEISKNQNEECQKTLPFGPGRIKTYNETARGDNKEITLTVDGPPSGFNPELISRVSPEDCEKTFGDLSFTFVIDKDGFLIEQKLSFDLLFVSNGQKKYGIYEESKALLTEEKIDSHENRESEQNKTARPE